jgi:hypothetical protein
MYRFTGRMVWDCMKDDSCHHRKQGAGECWHTMRLLCRAMRPRRIALSQHRITIHVATRLQRGPEPALSPLQSHDGGGLGPHGPIKPHRPGNAPLSAGSRGTDRGIGPEGDRIVRNCLPHWLCIVMRRDGHM